jgi:hypothetical protein
MQRRRCGTPTHEGGILFEILCRFLITRTLLSQTFLTARYSSSNKFQVPVELRLQVRTSFEHVSQHILQISVDLAQLAKFFSCPYFIPVHQRPEKLSHDRGLCLKRLDHIFDWDAIVILFIVDKHWCALCLTRRNSPCQDCTAPATSSCHHLPTAVPAPGSPRRAQKYTRICHNQAACRRTVAPSHRQSGRAASWPSSAVAPGVLGALRYQLRAGHLCDRECTPSPCGRLPQFRGAVRPRRDEGSHLAENPVNDLIPIA